jgi:pimeloyl-ACP methyl ester carboxylesterase
VNYVKSKDGTSIAFERTGQGPAVVIVCGVLGDHTQQTPLAALLAEHFTVYNYDRRGHGESGFTEPHAAEREFEDLEAMLDEAGGSAFVYGTSGLGIESLYAAAWGLAPKMKKLAIWEPPFILDGIRPRPENYRERLSSLLAEGRRGDMVELFMADGVGMPREFVQQMRQAAWWPAQEAAAHTLLHDAIVLGDWSLPKERIANVAVPTLVIDGGTTPWITAAAEAVASALPNAQRHTIAGQPHTVDHEALAPVLISFFES